VALVFYCVIVCQLLMRLRWSAMAASTCAILVWLGHCDLLRAADLGSVMIVSVKWSALKQNRWYEYLLRFGLGAGRRRHQPPVSGRPAVIGNRPDGHARVESIFLADEAGK
jgi:hypothetical protein